MLKCPHCGQPYIRPTRENLIDSVKLSNTQRRVVQVLLVHPEGVDANTIIGEVYDWGEKETDAAYSTIRVALYVLRLKLQTVGWTVSKTPKGRAVKGIYRLEELA